MARQARALISQKNNRPKLTVLIYGKDLRDAREESFVQMVCDGLTLGEAFVRAGFDKDAGTVAPARLWALERVQARAQEVLHARANQAAVTLPEVTAMLQRVYAKALANGEHNAAHNASFSLARLYGHVTDRATLEVTRRPSRDPDESPTKALGAWLDVIEQGSQQALNSPASLDAHLAIDAPQKPGQGPGPDVPTTSSGATLAAPLDVVASPEASFKGSGLGQGSSPAEKPNEINWLETGAQPGNGAPERPVTGTPASGAREDVLKNGGKSLLSLPKAEDLF
jgi:hypothetical protein